MTTEEVLLYTFYTFDLEMTAEIVYDTLRPRRCDEIIGKMRHVGLEICVQNSGPLRARPGCTKRSHTVMRSGPFKGQTRVPYIWTLRKGVSTLFA